MAGIRGGLAHNIRPITMSNAYRYVSTPAQAAAILNTPFCVIRTAGNEDMKVPSYFTEDELETIYSPIVFPDSTAVFRPMNVVVLILESFGSEYIGAMNPGKQDIHDCTPLVDSIINESLTFDVSLANGRKSIDAMPSVLAGIPMLKDHLFLTPTIMSKEITGLAKELGKMTYTFLGHEINLEGPWARVSMTDAIKEKTGIDFRAIDDLDTCLKLAEEHGIELEPHEKKFAHRDPVVMLSNFADSSVDLEVRVWLTPKEKMSLMADIREKIYNAFNREGIEIPFPQRDIHIITDK